MDSSREERRRRIMERGSDRIALITGQIQTINDGFPSSPTSNPHQRRESSSFIDANEPNATAEGTKDHSGSIEVSQHGENIDERDLVEPHLPRKSTTGSETMLTGNTASVQNPKVQTRFFSSKRINACVIASQRTRAICSFIIASLVVISYVDYPLLGVNLVQSESIIASRPLYMVLLTNATVVIARLFRERGKEHEHEHEETLNRNIPSKDDVWDGAVRLLERGLALYQTIRGIFIDCSVYLVVVICALSFV